MRALLSLALALPACAALAQQAAPPQRFLVTEQRIEGKALTPLNLWPVSIVAVGNDGRIFLTSRSTNAGIHVFGSDGKPLGGNLKTGWANETDILMAERMGRFKGDYWLSDPYGRQVAFMSPQGTIKDIMPRPTWVHPRWAERRKFPIFGGMDVLAVFPDSQWLVSPGRPRTLLDTPGYDRKLTHLLRIKPGGQIQREIARFDAESWRVMLRDGNRMQAMPVPFAARTFWSVADDGSRVVIVLPSSAPADSGTMRVVSIGGNGDTVFSRRYPAITERVSAARRDSALAAVRGWATLSADTVRGLIGKKMPAQRHFVTEVVAGLDGSTWIVTRAPQDTKVREALVLDERGNAIARTALHHQFTPVFVTRTHVWGVDKAKAGVVRMSLSATPAPTAAPPARTAKAHAARGRAPQ